MLRVLLHLGHNKVGDATAKTIADSLRGNSTVLRVLYISTYNIGPEGGVAIGEMLRVNVEMQDLNIASNQIGDAGAAGERHLTPPLALEASRSTPGFVRQCDVRWKCREYLSK